MRGGKLRGVAFFSLFWSRFAIKVTWPVELSCVEVECEVFMRGACKLQGRKVRGVTMTARGGDGETPCLLHNNIA